MNTKEVWRTQGSCLNHHEMMKNDIKEKLDELYAYIHETVIAMTREEEEQYINSMLLSVIARASKEHYEYAHPLSPKGWDKV